MPTGVDACRWGESGFLVRPFSEMVLDWRVCLSLEHAEENLLPDVRRSAIAYFAAKGINWHDGRDGKPSNHLCDWQVCYVKFLAPLPVAGDQLCARSPFALAPHR